LPLWKAPIAAASSAPTEQRSPARLAIPGMSSVNPYLGIGGGTFTGSSSVSIVGDCRLVAGGSCVVSPSYPDLYPENSKCEITGVPSTPLVVVEFNTEESWDKVTVNGQSFSGNGVASGPRGVIPADGTIGWVSDGSNRDTGWALCWASLPPAPPAPPPAPPMPPPAPLYPPLPEKFEVGAEM
jgi:hypothetical protein